MALDTYRAKRDFRRTPEPRGAKVARGRKAPQFVVQKHAASHLHYDFRLELDGVLVSWAVPKGPSLDPADKRLAMHVEDHPLEYGGFEGVIPAGEYGGGTVMVWDRGTWTPQGDAAKGYAEGHLNFTLDGDKLKGGFALVRTRGSRYGDKPGKEAWLLIKENDAYARAGGGAIVDKAPDSVASGRTLDEIAGEKSRVWRSKLSTTANVRAGAVAPVEPKPAAPTPAAPTPKGRKAALPATLSPMLATLVKAPPAGDDWIHEVKYDGYRMLARIDAGRVRLYSRNGNDWTDTFPDVVRDLGRLPIERAWIDGEAVVVDERGRTSFQALQNALSSPHAKGVAFYAFDVLYRDGEDLRGLPLTERRNVLEAIVGRGVGTVKPSLAIQGGGEEFFRQACALGLEGAIAKRADSTYASGGRSRNWVKVKCVQRQEMVIGGFTDPQGSRSGFGALLIGYYQGDELRYAGKVGTGFDTAAIRALAPQLEKREQPTPPFANPPRGYAAKGAHWIKPDLVAEIAFTEWSRDGALRHPSFQGLRLDKKARDVVRERPAAGAGTAAPATTKSKTAKAETTAAKTKGAKARAAKAAPVRPAGKAVAARRVSAEGNVIAGVTLSHPDKLYFPEAGITKGELARYYASVADRLVPHLAGRPLSLVRCPDGWSGQCFYQKHAAKSVNASVTRVEVPEGKGTATYMSAGSASAVVALVQWGVVEFHPWGSRMPRLDRPDRLIFDLDPDDGLAWEALATAVGLVRTLLQELALEGFLKTTGGKGMHVVVPVRPTLSWDDAKTFARDVAMLLARTFPDRFTATMSKESRRGRIFIDYLRNAEGATAIAPYAVRARKNAPVATPIDVAELARDVRFDYFNVRNIAARLARERRDPWAAFDATRQTITAAMRKRVR